MFRYLLRRGCGGQYPVLLKLRRTKRGGVHPIAVGRLARHIRDPESSEQDVVFGSSFK